MSFQPFARYSKPGSRAYSGERVVNYFARPNDGGVSPIILVGTGGMVSYLDLGTGRPVRAMTSMGGSMYVASGAKLWRITSGAAVDVGDIEDGETYIAANRTQVAVVVQGKYYVCDGAETAEYSPGAIDNPVGIAQTDGYMLVIGSGAGQGDVMQISALDDATTFDATDFIVAEYSADRLLGTIFDHSEVYLFGDETIERYQNQQVSGEFPFVRVNGATVEHGCIHGKTIAKADNAVFWVTPDFKVARSLGSDPQWISTPEIKEELEGSEITGGFTFSDQGHEFYAITRRAKTTLIYDMVTGLWHERSSGLDYGPWLANSSLMFQGTQYFGCDNGQIATVSDTVFEDFGETLAAEAVAPLVANSGRYFRVSRVYLSVDGGTGGIGRQPQVMLQVSRDGFTWSNELWRELGKLGQYKRRAQWNSLGQFEQGKIRVRITDNVPRNIIGVAVDYG